MSLDDLLAHDDSSAWRFLRHCAKRLQRHPALRMADREDLIQDLLLIATQRWPNFDPRRACAMTFFCRVMAHGAITLVRRAERQKRDARRVAGSLDAASDEEGGRSWIDSIEASQRAAHTFQQRRSAEEAFELHRDVTALRESLSPEDRELAEHLQSLSPHAVTEVTGWTAHRVRSRLAAIRARFEAENLGEYL